MPKPNNAYLAKKQAEQEARDLVIKQWSWQMAYDALTLVLNDKEVMGKDVFGIQRLKRINKALNDKITEMMPALSKAANASYVRSQVDRELEKICGEEFEPWEVRYPWWDDRGI